MCAKKKSAKLARESSWQFQTAMDRFGELFRRARSEGPRWVTRDDNVAVVVVSAEQFERLLERSRHPRNLVRFFAKSPLAKVPINLERKPDPGRKIEP